MATWVGKPEPSKFPQGTAVHLYPFPKTPWSQTGKPPGTQVTEATIASDGSLTFTGLTEGTAYLGWASVSAVDQYLTVVADKAAASAAVSSVNGKEGAVTLTAADVEAVGTESPALTGTPTGPTAAKGTNTTQLATTAFAHTTQTDAEAAAASKDSTAKTTTLSEAATAAAGKDATLKGEAETKDAAAQAAAEAASQKRQAVHAAVTSEVTLGLDELTPVDATSGALKAKLPTGAGAGRVIAVEKKDASTNEVTVEGNIRGEAAQSIVLKYAKEVFLLESDSSGSWWVIGRYVSLASIKEATRTIQYRTIFLTPASVPGNEQLGAWDVKLVTGEKRKLLWARYATVSGTINLAIKRGAAGATEIAAYKELAVTSTTATTSSTQELSDGDIVTVTGSGGASPKGLRVTIAEEVIAP